MITAAEFPANCSTNSYILYDFTEIAYIVCTGATASSANGVPNTDDDNSKQNILVRLQNAEKQFRNASILVSLDIEKLELFTFYKKVDVVKDQRTILSKFGYVCRMNSCNIASKNAARVLDLLKPESARVHRLFVAALLSSINLTTQDGSKAIDIGHNLYLVPAWPDGGNDYGPSGAKAFDLFRSWYLHRIELQIIPNGHLFLTLQKLDSMPLTLLADLDDSEDCSMGDVDSDTIFYLSPFGQLARFRNGWHGLKPDYCTGSVFQSPSVSVPENIDLWTENVISLLQSRNCGGTEKLQHSKWIEVEIPILEDGNSINHKATIKEISWKTIMWPTSLVYASLRTSTATPTADIEGMSADPLSFVRDWYMHSAERAQSLSNAEKQEIPEVQTEDEPLFDDEAQFDHAEQLVSHVPLTFPANQTVYPTPPDVIMAHPTPGMSSVDGIAPTPANVPLAARRIGSGFPDTDMQDFDGHSLSHQAGSGFYDSEGDLFGDDLNHRNGNTALGEEDPKWDFLDEPDFELDPTDIAKIEQYTTDDVHTKDVQSSHGNAPMDLVEGNHILQGLETPYDLKKNEDSEPKDATEAQSDLYQPSHDDSNYGSRETLRKSSSPRAATLNRKTPGPVSPSLLSKGADARSARVRRGSVYELLASDTGKRDLRYVTRGKYWFDPAASSVTRLAGTQFRIPERSTSCDSEEPESSGSSSTDDEEQPAPGTRIQPEWTTYEALSNAEEPSPNDAVIEHADAERHIAQLLKVLSTATGDEPFLCPTTTRHTPTAPPKTSGTRMLMIAQLLVDQLSQSNLWSEKTSFLNLQYQTKHLRVDLSMENGGANTKLKSATLADLTTMPASPSAIKSPPKINGLESSRVEVSLLNERISALPSILRFWELMGLHPANGAKNVVAYCLHPEGDNLSMSSANFMAQMGDVYRSCNFGEYTVGRAPDMSSSGILSWVSNSQAHGNLTDICERLGTALASAAVGERTRLVFVVVPDDDLSKAVDICDACVVLFERYIQKRESTRNDIAIQLIPKSFISTTGALVVPNHDQYLQLAIEVYNRLLSDAAIGQVVTPGGAAILARRQSINLSFELTTKAKSPFSRVGRFLHLALSSSPDKRWMTAAWTDELGTTALTMSYCFQSNSADPSRPRLEIFRDIWEVSLAVMNRERGQWQLAVAKVGFWELEEIQEWLYLSSHTEGPHKASVRMLLLNVELQPRMTFSSPSPVSRPSQAQPVIANQSNTPVSTPQASTTSPEQAVVATPTPSSHPHANPATPPDHGFDSLGDTDMKLLDPLEESWSASLAFGLNQSQKFLEVRPALSSGLLLKRSLGSGRDNNGIAAIGVSLITMSRTPGSSTSHAERDVVLQEVLAQYRGLVTMAATRGCIDCRTECVPWHVSTAVKGSRILGELL